MIPAAAYPLYAGISADVNTSSDSSATSHTLPLAGLPFAGDWLSTYIRGVVAAMKKPPKWGSVLAALLSHYNPAHDIVWPGIDCLASESSTSPSTVKRALAWARKALGLVVVCGDELSTGPGQHNFVGARRSVDQRETNTYSIGAFARLLPQRLVDALRAVLAGSLVEDSETGLDGLPILPNPFDDIQTLDIPPAQNVNVNQEEKEVRGGLPFEAKLQVLARLRDILGVRIDPYNKKQDPGFQALRDLGIWAVPARRICAKFGDPWALKLAAYAAWAPRVQDRGKYARVTARDWVGSPDNWPEWFPEKWDRAAARASRLLSADTPPSLQSAAVARVPLELDDLAADVRADLLHRAFQSLLASLPIELRGPVERAGVHHPMVRGRALSLMQQDACAGGSTLPKINISESVINEGRASL